VNAAGITHYSPLFATTEELLEKIVHTNLMGTMLGCKAMGKAMMGNANGGCIINVASLLGLKGGRGSAGYVASKAGVIGKEHHLYQKQSLTDHRFDTSSRRRSRKIQYSCQCHSTRIHRNRHDSWYVFLHSSPLLI
jgi:NADP-dependent 3-hydroxy acid dehydrogenase YdfG